MTTVNSLAVVALSTAVLVAGCTTSTADANAAAVNSGGSSATTGLWTRWQAAATRSVTIPSGTALHLTLNGAVASDTSRLEDVVTAELTRPILVDGRAVLPAGATVAGIVSGVDDSGRVKGRAHVAIDFTSVTIGGSHYPMSTTRWSRRAPATTGEDATRIGIGGGAGTGVALATTGDEVRLASGAAVTTQLTAPLTVRLN